MGFLALLIPLTPGLSVVVLVITAPAAVRVLVLLKLVPVITVSVITVSVITVSVITVPVITVPVITVPVITITVITITVITITVITITVIMISVIVVAITIVIMVIMVTITVVVMVMAKQCFRGRRHRFFGNVYRGVECLAGGFERVKRGTNGVTGHPEGILDYFTCKALVIPVMTVMSTADSDQRGHHSE